MSEGYEVPTELPGSTILMVQLCNTTWTKKKSVLFLLYLVLSQVILHYYSVLVGSTVFVEVFRICIREIEKSRNQEIEKFKKLKFPNFQTMVAGLRNSSTAGHIVLILYSVILYTVYSTVNNVF